MEDLKRLMEQRAALDKQISEEMDARREEARDAVTKVALKYGFQISDLFELKIKRGEPVPAKYASKDGKHIWSGRGLTPKWLQTEVNNGAKLEDLAI